jgi:holliday junction DNA helicase RuvA
MIVRLRGQLSEVNETAVVLDRDGIAYEVFVPSYAVTELSACRGEEVTLHTLEYLEGGTAGGNITPRIIGFLHPEDRAFFKQFTTVKGVGVRKGLRALAAPAAQIASLIEAGDTTGLARLPGIGKRLAETIVAELRGKVSAHAYAAGAVPAAARREFTEDQGLAVEILVQWGDTRPDAERWIARAAQLRDDLGSPEDWVRAAYRIKGGGES